jgi:hypothetical protein
MGRGPYLRKSKKRKEKRKEENSKKEKEKKKGKKEISKKRKIYHGCERVEKTRRAGKKAGTEQLGTPCG